MESRMKIILGVVFLVILTAGAVFLWKKIPRDETEQTANIPEERPADQIPTSTTPDILGDQIASQPQPPAFPTPVPPRTGRDEFSTSRP